MKKEMQRMSKASANILDPNSDRCESSRLKAQNNQSRRVFLVMMTLSFWKVMGSRADLVIMYACSLQS